MATDNSASTWRLIFISLHLVTFNPISTWRQIFISLHLATDLIVEAHAPRPVHDLKLGTAPLIQLWHGFIISPQS